MHEVQETPKQTIEKGSKGFANAIEITIDKFWSDLGSKIRFTLDEVEKMMSSHHDSKEPLFFHIHGKIYKIPWDSIDNYFKTHEKPQPPMSKDEQLAYWKKRALELEQKMIESEKGPEVEKPEIPDEPETEDEDVFPESPAEPSTEIPEQDKGIPVPSKEERERDRQSLSEIQEDLKTDLESKKKKAVSNRRGKYLRAKPKNIPKVEEAL